MPSPSGTAAMPSRSYSNSSKPRIAGRLEQTDASGCIVSVKHILHGKELIIGRDRAKCQLVINDPRISAKHLRVYSVVYDSNDVTEVDMLVYAEDLSRNGTYWNASLIGRGNGGFLLSPDDVLKLSSAVSLTFKSMTPASSTSASFFDPLQEQEMEKFGSKFIVTDRLLGSGSFGKVFMAVEQTTRVQLACKVVDLRRLRPTMRFGRKEDPRPAQEVDERDQLRKVKQWSDQQTRENQLDSKLKTYYREAEILASLRHPNIIGLEKVFVTDNTIYMFQDLVTGGDLFSYLESKHGQLSEVEAAVVIRQIVIALCFLHEKNIVHRDLKPDNILMTSLSTGCRVILTDFGAARKLHPRQRMMSLAGTDEYVAPEVTAGRSSTTGYTKAVDLWSLGCVASVLLTGASAFADPLTQQYSAILAEQGDLRSLRQSREWQAVRQRPKDFVERLLVLVEDQRMTAPEALKHGWFSNDHHKTNFEDLYQRSIKYWRPRLARNNLFDFSHARNAQKVAREQGIIPEKSRNLGPRPSQIVESHYQPFPRQVHSSFLWPKRRPSASYISPETKTAMDSWPSENQAVEDSPTNANPPRRRRSGSHDFSIPGLALGRDTATSPHFSPSCELMTARSNSLPHTPKRRPSVLDLPFEVPLRVAITSPGKKETMSQELGSRTTPSRLKRRSEMTPPLASANGQPKRRRSSVYDFDEPEGSVDLVYRKRSRGGGRENAEDLNMPHHATAVADDDSSESPRY